MKNTIEEKLNISEWISVEEASNLLNLSERTIKDYCRSGKLGFKIEKSGNNFKYLVFFNSLPEYAKNKILTNSEKSNYSEAPDWAKIQVEKYLPLLNRTKELKGVALDEFIKKWNRENPNLSTSYSSLIRMRKVLLYLQQFQLFLLCLNLLRVQL